MDRLNVVENRLNNQQTEMETLRMLLRKMRFEHESKYRRDSTFYDGARRRLLQFWDGNPAAFNDVPPAQLAFLLILLDANPKP